MGYIREIDAIRAIAIFFVICNHWLLESSYIYKVTTIVSAPDIFFTISGFLITSILIKDRERAEKINSSRLSVFKFFFIKRALRIFPAYYLTLLVTYLLNKDSISNYTSYLLFTTNFDLYNKQYWGYLTHLWSMAVEQQFYLFWPLIILFIPKKFMLPSIVLFIVCGIISQHLVPQNAFTLLLPQTCFDTLGIGALLAWVTATKYHLLKKCYQILRILAAFSIIIIVAQGIWGNFFYVQHRTLIAIVTTWLIAHFIVGQNKVKSDDNSIFNNKILLQIGKMSYGIYLYHLTLFFHSQKVLVPINNFFSLPEFIKTSRSFFIMENFVILMLLSWLSWKYFELPISNAKKYFQRKKLDVSSVEKVYIEAS